MHTFSETGAGVPAFLAKLWRLVDDPDTNNLICWSKDGRSFIIQNQAQFARELLPLNYKHNNMASFIRQLNMYGFHKITSIDNGGLKFDRDEMEFSHPCFKRNCPYLLEHIKRKIANTKSLDDKTAVKPEAVSKVLQDVKAMRGRQDSLDSRFSVMKQENEALWREIASLRQKHAKQQQIVNKLIQFLITIVQPSRNMTSVKRHMQLMINDTPEYAKLRKTSESESDSGPVIHELGEELLDEVNDSDVELLDPNSPYAKSYAAHVAHDTESPSPLNIERPHSSISMTSQNYDYSNQSAEDVLNAAAAATAPGGNGLISDAAAAASSIIQSVNSDGSQIVYHVTEVPDAHPRDAVTPANYMEEENVLTTPMVRQEMARTQLLKQKSSNKRRRPAVATSPAMMESVATATSPKVQRISNQQQPQQKQQPQQQQQHQGPENIQIKSEQEIDPMIFLNVYPDNRVNTPNPSMMSPNLSEDSRQSGMNAGQGFTSTNMGQTPELYNPNDFIGSDMPADIFEDNSMLAGNNSNFSDNFKLNEQQQYGLSTAAGGKFSSFIAGNNNNNNNNNNNGNSNNSATTGASTSAAAAAAARPSSSSSALSTSASNNGASSSSTSNTANRPTTYTGGKNGSNMAVAKYKNAAALPHEEVLRDDVHGHLDNMQDELESLKDLLRGDVYSLDANTLLGNSGSTAALNNNRLYLAQALEGDFFTKLFNDSDILGPYGLNLTADGPNDKKGGSELMSYQPIYDLSDIMDINNKNELDAATDSDSVAAPSSSRQLQSQSSVLNTPYHE